MFDFETIKNFLRRYLFMLDWIATSTMPDFVIDKIKELKKG